MLYQLSYSRMNRYSTSGLHECQALALRWAGNYVSYGPLRNFIGAPGVDCCG